MVTKDSKKAKKPAKKTVKADRPVVTGATVLDTIFSKNSLWSMSCQLEEVSIEIEKIRDLLHLIAENTFDTKCNLIWLAADLLEPQMKQVDYIQNELMEMHRTKDQKKK